MTQFTNKTRIALSFEAKLCEMEFFLRMMESEWGATILELTQNGQLKDLAHLEKINYYFSGFSNSFQSVKDILHTITGDTPWRTFSTIENCSFIKNSRNAVTHDGLQLISTIHGGLYYVEHAGGTLRRYDDKNNEVEIPCPAEDIITVCKQFYSDLLKKIKEIIEANPRVFEAVNQYVSDIATQSINESSAVPDFVKKMVNKHPTLISDAILQIEQQSNKTLIDKINERILRIAPENT